MNPRTVFRLTSALLLSAGSFAAAQPAADESPYEPPLMRFEQELGLVDAVRLTLEHDPLIRLQETQLAYTEGVLQEATGEFDTTLSGNASYDYKRQELPEDRKKAEREKREDLDDAIAQTEGLEDDFTRAADLLNDPSFLQNPRGYQLPPEIDNEELRDDLEIIRQQIILLNDLIARAVDPAIRQDLIDLRNQLLASSLGRLANGLAEAVEGIEDLRNRRAALGDAPTDQWQRTGSFEVNAARKLRSGLLVSPYVSWKYSASNFVGKDSTDPEEGGMGIEPLYTAEVGFDVLIPLKRGRGREAVTASERAAQADLEAKRMSYLHQKSRSVLDATLAYWDLRAAQEEIGVLTRSVKLQESFLTMTRALVKARQLPRAEETRARASMADAQARLEAGDKRLRQAQVTLARIMGVTLADMETAPMAAETFPTPPDEVSSGPDQLAQLVQLALEHRQDRQAAQHAQDSAGILTRGAQLNTRRLLNLDVKAWGNSTSDNPSNFDRWVFRSGSAGIEMDVPFKNNRLLGRLAQRRATESRTIIDLKDLERRIALAVLRNAGTLSASIEQLKLARQAVRQYDRTVDDEQARFKLGESTLIDVILTEQQASSARQALIAAARDFASLVATLRYEAGLLVEEKDGQASVSTASLLDVPEALRPAAPAEAAPEGDAAEGEVSK